MLLIGCGGGTSAPVAPPPIPAVQALQVTDVQNIVTTAVNSVNAEMVVAVVDRAGFVLGVFRTQNAPATTSGNFGQMLNANDVAVALARTGAFFSNDQAPLSSRTVRFISGIHFPPGVVNQPPADLYGIENTKLARPLMNRTSGLRGFAAGPATGTGSFLVAPTNSQGQPPEGDLIAPAAGPQGGLSAADVTQILDNAEATANTTRAAIRLPLGSKARMVIAVADLDGTIIGLRRMQDSTVFSIDLAASKARNMVYFNSAVRTAAYLDGVPMGM